MTSAWNNTNMTEFNVSSFDAASAVVRIDGPIDFPETLDPWTALDSRFADAFAARFTGFLRIATPGDYTLFLTSDDGARLWLDGQLIIDNDGLHGPTE